MCDGDRSASLDLFHEQRNDAARRSDDISESHNRHFHIALTCNIEEKHFCCALGCSHDTRGIDRFVRRNEDESIGTVFCADLGKRSCGERVVAYVFFWIFLAERNVLMCRRMNDDLRFFPLDEPFHYGAVANIEQVARDARRRPWQLAAQPFPPLV